MVIVFLLISSIFIPTKRPEQGFKVCNKAMKNQITLQELATKIEGNYWEKGDLKRVYLERGHNTKKMSTKTYVTVDPNGGFKVVCKVDCPSQPWQWCQSQENEVIESVLTQIDQVIALQDVTLVKYKHLVESEGFMVYVKQGDADPIWYTESQFDEKFGKYPESVFPEYKTFYEEKIAAMKPVTEEPKPAAFGTEKKIIINTDTPQFGIGTKVSHPKFGIGEVTAESDTTIQIVFDSVGVKELMKGFARLEAVQG